DPTHPVGHGVPGCPGVDTYELVCADEQYSALRRRHHLDHQLWARRSRAESADSAGKGRTTVEGGDDPRPLTVAWRREEGARSSWIATLTLSPGIKLTSRFRPLLLRNRRQT